MLWTINFSYDPGGEITRIKGIARDITMRKQAERELLQSFTEIKQLKNQLASESEYLREEIKAEHDFENIIGKSAAIKYVFYKMEQVAALDTTVLIQGETGSGKELVARAIHNLSPRVNRPLIKVNCAALPLHLMESELFGHEKGSFTGAHMKQIGRFELANGATLFLDEIGELPLELQAKLLRVLEEGEFESIGSSKTVKVDVRIIAATNRNLETEVQEGRFRKDLLYRLKVYPITVPPLRERVEDIPLLANLFLEIFNKKMARKIDHVSIATMEALQKYSWPGNVRELRNVIERAVINSSGLKLRLMEKLETTSKEAPDSLRPLKEVERNYIVTVLENTSWRIDGPKGAALILDLNPSTLRSRMRKLDITKPQA
jgi:transcriptional regulator with GAF, ATPase, and Fis domain